MKYKKLMANTFGQRSDHSAQLAVALIAGLAVGAVVAVLFAQKSGKDMRRQITSLINRINDRNAERDKRDGGVRNGAEQDQMDHHVNQAVNKKPKSNIKELIHEAHVGGGHTEQGI